MIQANELRIGNLVQANSEHRHRYTQYGRVTAIYGSDAKEERFTVDYHHPGTWFEPVKLSPEILEACGFHHLHSNTKRGRYYVEAPYIGGELRSEIAWWPITQVISINSTFNVEGEELQYTELYLPHIRHLHQLMNLWHSLTGTELSINLEKVKA